MLLFWVQGADVTKLYMTVYITKIYNLLTSFNVFEKKKTHQGSIILLKNNNNY